MAKIYWVSRHNLSAAQLAALAALHGAEIEVVKDAATLIGLQGLADYIREHADGFVYAVGGGQHYIAAALAGLKFGVFENHPQKRVDGSFGLASVYHVGNGKIEQVWVNPDPESDLGEALIPVAR